MSLKLVFIRILYTLSFFATVNGWAQIPKSIDSIYEVSKETHKPVLLYFHFNGCGACVQMEKETLNDDVTKAIIDSNYLYLSVNTLKGDGPQIKKYFNIVGHPTFLFIDTNQVVYHKMVGYFSRNNFEAVLHKEGLMNNENALTNLRRRYVKGERDTSFLYTYIYSLNRASELNDSVIDDYFSRVEAYSSVNNMKMFYDFSVKSGHCYIKFNSPYFNYVVKNIDSFYKVYDSTQVDVRVIYICFDAIERAKLLKDKELFEEAIVTLKPYDNRGVLYLKSAIDDGAVGMVMTKNMTKYAQVDFYKNIDSTLYKQYLKEKKSLVWNDLDELNTLSWVVAKYSKDSTKYEESLDYVKRAIELHPESNNYYTYSLLLFKTGKTKDAIKACERSIKYCKKEKKEFKAQERLLNQMRESAANEN